MQSHCTVIFRGISDIPPFCNSMFSHLVQFMPLPGTLALHEWFHLNLFLQSQMSLCAEHERLSYILQHLNMFWLIVQAFRSKHITYAGTKQSCIYNLHNKVSSGEWSQTVHCFLTTLLGVDVLIINLSVIKSHLNSHSTPWMFILIHANQKASGN